ncbi:MAG: DNA polymerase III subunit gamma/tau [Clostridia bacterium]|nr:DNA polymerase III subunit gamma/tau [Clostridia bacterium]
MYQALYRKWRPSSFGEVSGQPQVTLTLLNELKSGRISHAYLFTGSRGTGKTSCAKILAKAVNCENPVDGEPCCVCEMCRSAENGDAPDIIEIDAASNNGVDNIRDIREEVNLSPFRGKYRVYIIDEVHMLSQGAFNALLKTLEEPPAHVIFILATTEVHKLPATVLSRCQRFDFKRISPENISDRLKVIANGEGFGITDDAAALIARLADGGMRDAVSLLDRCCARGSDIDTATVASAAGIAGTAHLFEMSGYIAQKDTASCLTLVNRLHREACDIESLCSELTYHFRNLMIAKTVENCSSLITAAPDEIKELKERASLFKLSKILACLDILEDTLKNMKGAQSKKILLESAVIRMCSGIKSNDTEDNDISELRQRIAELEKKIGSDRVNKTYIQEDFSEKQVNNSPQEPYIEKKFVQSVAENTPEPEEKLKPDYVRKSPVFSDTDEKPVQPGNIEMTQWAEVLDEVKKHDIPLYYMLHTTTAYINNGINLVIRTDNPRLFPFIIEKETSHAKELSAAVFSVTGKRYKLRIDDKNKTVQDNKNPLENLREKINNFNNSQEENL